MAIISNFESVLSESDVGFLHLVVICKPKLSSLNHRNELVSACRRRKKHLLCNNGTILDP